MNNTNEKIYVSSDGTKTPIKNLETTHLINGLMKAYRESFGSKNHKEFSAYIEKINMCKEELHRRINDFSGKLGD